MKKAIAGVILGCWAFSCASIGLAEEVKLVASQYSDRYHVSTCKIVKKIRPADLIVFKTPEEAVAQGLVPCKKCDPPTPKTDKGSNFN